MIATLGTLTDVPGVRVGHAEVEGGGSGCTVLLGPFRASVDVRGFATGSRELDVLDPRHLVPRIDALLFTGGSAFGLGAADGVMAWLEERGEGFDTGVARVPIVPTAVVFDLAPERPRPGPAEGRRACDAATDDQVPEGRVGAGAGALVGKLSGREAASPGGLGTASGTLGTHRMGALVVVNAVGDVLGRDGTILAGARDGSGSFLDSARLLRGMGGVERFGGAGPGAPGTNTTLAVVVTDAPLSRVDLGRLARIASTGLSRRISPVNTPFDGDLVFALSTAEGERETSPGRLTALGTVARDLVEEAIERAVSPARSAAAPTERRPRGEP